MQTNPHKELGVVLQAPETWKHIPEQNKHNSNIAAYCLKNNSRSLDNLLEESPRVLGRTRKRRKGRRGSANSAHGNTAKVLRRKELVRRRMEEIGSSLLLLLGCFYFCFFVAFGFAFGFVFLLFLFLCFAFLFAFYQVKSKKLQTQGKKDKKQNKKKERGQGQAGPLEY